MIIDGTAECVQTLVVEAFGQLSPYVDRSGDHHGEDLYSVFRARAELMGWSSSMLPQRRLLWGMNDAELTSGTGTTRIGWVQVGLERGVEPALALPALFSVPR